MQAVFAVIVRVACASLYVLAQPQGPNTLATTAEKEARGAAASPLLPILRGKNIMDASKIKMAYSISERNGKSYFSKVGVGFINKDGSWNLKLESFPINGEIHIRDYVPRDESDGPGVARARSNGHSKAVAAE